MVVKNTSGMLYDITPGTSAAEKAVIMDKSNKIDSLDITTLKVGGVDKSSLVISEEITLTEADGSAAGVYTGDVAVPAGATLLDVIIHAVALWDAGTSATLIAGDVADPNGFFAAVDLLATNLLAGEAISFTHTGGLEGADLDGGETAGDHTRRRFLATARVVTAEVTTVGTVGTLGVTRMTVVYSLPKTPVAATFVAT